MPSMLLVQTTRYRRGRLPHWEVEHGRYFVTFRLGDSLPRTTVERLCEIHQTIAAINARTDDFVRLQRRYFHMMEKYLDGGEGTCLLRNAMPAATVAEELAALQEWAVEVPHYTIMPNHVHALIDPQAACAHSLAQIMKRLKGRTAYRIRQSDAGEGPLWQREWFDRWMRTDAEWDKTVDYIHQNPVKAGLVSRWQDHIWMK